MSLVHEIDERSKAAMKAHDAVAVSTLRMVRAKLKDYAIEKRISGEIPDAEAQAVIATYVKQLRKSVPEFEKGGEAAREAIARIRAEIAFLEPFLPTLLDEAATREIVARVIAEMGKPPAQKSGMVMGRIMKEHAGQVDAALVRRLVDEALAG
jgi:uncharacterized protein YqeY